MGNKEAKRYAKERNRAFLSLDEGKIRAFCKKIRSADPGRRAGVLGRST